MKPRILYVLALAALLAGCTAQKRAPKAGLSAAAYAAALNALEAGAFQIEAREFRFTSGGQAPVISTNSYVQMHAGRATVEFGRHITSKTTIIAESMFHQHATLTRDRPTANGDPQFTLQVSDSENYYSIRLAIRLFKDTNECFVKVYYGSNRNPYDFKGYIYPFDPQNTTQQP